MIGNRKCTFALSAASTIICSAPPAIAANFDGNWSMAAVTTRGHCGNVEIGFGINRGRIYSTGWIFRFLRDLVGRPRFCVGACPDECSGWPAHRTWDRTVRAVSRQRGLGGSRALRPLLGRLERQPLLTGRGQAITLSGWAGRPKSKWCLGSRSNLDPNLSPPVDLPMCADPIQY